MKWILTLTAVLVLGYALFAHHQRSTPQTIVKYKILSSDTREGLESAVNEAMQAGYQPLGGVSGMERGYAQAVGK